MAETESTTTGAPGVFKRYVLRTTKDGDDATVIAQLKELFAECVRDNDAKAAIETLEVMTDLLEKQYARDAEKHLDIMPKNVFLRCKLMDLYAHIRPQIMSEQLKAPDAHEAVLQRILDGWSPVSEQDVEHVFAFLNDVYATARYLPSPSLAKLVLRLFSRGAERLPPEMLNRWIAMPGTCDDIVVKLGLERAHASDPVALKHDAMRAELVIAPSFLYTPELRSYVEEAVDTATEVAECIGSCKERIGGDVKITVLHIDAQQIKLRVLLRDAGTDVLEQHIRDAFTGTHWQITVVTCSESNCEKAEHRFTCSGLVPF